MKLRALSQHIVLSWGWRRALIAFVAGAVSVLALAPVNAWPVLFVTFPVLVWLIDGAGAGRLGGVWSAAFTGWCFGFGYFVAGLYWIGYAFLVDAKTFGWLLPVAVTGLPAYLALFTAFGAGLARWLWSRGSGRILALAACLTLAEWLRGYLLTGFPWNAFGYALTGPLALAQTASLTGIWGLTLLAVAIFASPAVLADDRRDNPRRAWPPVAGLAVLAAMAVFGMVRLATTPTAFVPDVRLRLMQPDLPQDDRFNYAAKPAVMQRYLTLSDRATGPQASGVKDATHLIWPESAFPFFLTREPDALAQIAGLLPPGKTLITGAVRMPDDPRLARRAYNAIYAIGDDGGVLAVADKVHLVPFGEYLPFQDALERLGLMHLTKLPGGFLAADRRRLIHIPGLPPVLPLVCYEAVFPDELMPPGERPGLMINLTNDGWFGISLGPYQHLQQARLRAVEQGVPLVRVANTGISAVVDPLGRMIRSLPLGVAGVVDAPLPATVAAPFYARYGSLPVFAAIAIVLAALGRRRFKINRGAQSI